MRSEVLRLRKKRWKTTAIVHRLEEKNWLDGCDVQDHRRRWNTVRRLLVREGLLNPPGEVNPYIASHRFKLTPAMLVEAGRWLDADRPLHELPRRFNKRGWLKPHEAYYCWLALQRLDRASMDELADAVDTFDTLAGKGKRQGWRVSPKERRAIELHAVAKATRYFKALGFEVEDVGARESYDLVCRRPGSTMRVEVKGTTGTGSAILLTAKEVEHAKQTRGPLALFVLTRIKLTKQGESVSCTGGVRHLRDPWRITEHGTLSPVGYNYWLVD
jgi:hypothetical protein